ncbi:MAG: hypothetical protein K2R98_30360 [Gemmataceae bacterium]|nr:hypothetical protein [Gemmataceae bacterium]
MTGTRSLRAARARNGVILLVVITLLTLFAVVGITFVIYAQAEASAARIDREAQSMQRPDMDPEMLLSYFLGQLVYGTDNPLSALRGHSLAETMYGKPGGTIAFNGPGRFHTAAPDKYYQPDYTPYGGVAINPDDFGTPNVPYTYPDFNNVFLAAVQGSSGGVLIPSYYRTDANGAVVSLRPSTTYHTAFPAMEDGRGDVKNLADSPGFLNPANGQYTNNDSIWIDVGFPVMKAPDGRRFKPLFAPLIQDLDNRINVNVHGNTLGNIGGGYWGVSHQGWAPGEVIIDRVIGNNEAGNLFMGSGGITGRYDATRWANFWGGGGWGGRSNEELKGIYSPGGHFYTSTNLDCWPPDDANQLMPAAVGKGFSFPYLTGAYSHGWMQRNDDVFHPNLYNFFDPRQNAYWLGSPPAEVLNNRSFPHSNLEALLRYSDKGSPALTSDLFRLCPTSFAQAKARRLVTTLSMDLSAPGLMPSILNAAGGASPYQLAAGSNFPTRPAINFPAAAVNPASGEFNVNRSAISNAAQALKVLKRIDLNRGFTDYPMLNAQNMVDATGYGKSLKERQDMAREIFDVLRGVTGAGDPATATAGTAEYDALRWLAQLAVNIVDYVQFPRAQTAQATVAAPDDIMTSFNWNPAQKGSINNGWVFGTVLPRLVVNEAYVEIGNTQADVTAAKMKATQYDVNCWVELHNPFASDTGAGQLGGHVAVPVPMSGTARLYFPDPGYAGYRVIVAQTVADNDATKDNAKELTKPDNVLGMPINVKTIVDQYTPDGAVANLALAGDDLNQVKPGYESASTSVPKCPDGENKGYYVLGPSMPFPGTGGAAKFFATLPVKEQACTDPNFAGTNSSMHYVYTPGDPALADFTKLKHTIVLQRLACPYMKPDPDPNSATFNPYVTVDFILTKAPPYDNVTFDGVGPHVNPKQDRCSYGRSQPYAADISQQIAQKAGANTVQHTLFDKNAQNDQGNQALFAYDWLVHMNRPIINPMELLHVSGFKPHQLTQMFMLGVNANTGGPMQKFMHRAPWMNESTMIFRAMEFFEGGMRPQWSPIGGRFSGRINLNTVWDIETFQALCDQRGANWFNAAAVTNVYNRMVASRTKNASGVPGAGDRPFLTMAAPYAPNGDVQYPTGAGIDDTFMRVDPNNAGRRLFETDPATEMRNNPTSGQPVDHPYFKYELMTKIFGNTTTRSNAFAVWVTVGFFEVLDDSDPTKPAKLGKEIGRSENRHVRHRMFAIVDRTNLALDPANAGKPGSRPFFIDALSAVSQPGAATVSVPTLSGKYEDASWGIGQGTVLVIDAGPNQETVTVTAVDPVNLTFTATFNNAHPVGFAISNATLGNPGPQPSFDPRNPNYAGVVRYFSIIE